MAPTTSSGRPVDVGEPRAIQNATATKPDTPRNPGFPTPGEMENIPTDWSARLDGNYLEVLEYGITLHT